MTVSTDHSRHAKVSERTSSSNSTKAKPFARPLSSVGTRTSLIAPYGSNSLRKSTSLTDLARLAMYSSRLLALASVRFFLRDGSETKTERGWPGSSSVPCSSRAA